MSDLLRKAIPVLAVLFLIACTAGKTSQGGEILLPQPGKVHKKLSIYGGNGLTYSLYLPSGCGKGFTPGDTGKRYPVILCFDPAGDGSLPVSRFSGLAEKYGFILLGSNDSRNSQAPEESEAIVQALFNEAETRLPSDSKAIYTSGFSGGARVATAAAMFRPWIRGVIACGAGFPSGVQPPNYRFDYFGIVGLGDFNLTEMTELDQSLDYLKMRHFILDYDGIHTWAGTKQFDMALRWHLLNLSRDGKTRKNDSLVSLVYNTVLADDDSLVKAGRLLYARQSLAYGISCLQGLTNTDPLKAKLEQLEKDERYLTAVKNRNSILEKEKKEQQLLMEAMFSKDQKWWQGKLAKLRDNGRPGLSPEDTLMNRRLIAFLGLLCYSNASALVRQHQDSQAKSVLAIYAMVEPENPEPYYVLAVIAARENDQVTAMAMLEKSYERGFRNPKRAQSQPEFSILKDNKGYFDFIRKIQ